MSLGETWTSCYRPCNGPHTYLVVDSKGAPRTCFITTNGGRALFHTEGWVGMPYAYTSNSESGFRGRLTYTGIGNIKEQGAGDTHVHYNII